VKAPALALLRAQAPVLLAALPKAEAQLIVEVAAEQLVRERAHALPLEHAESLMRLLVLRQQPQAEARALSGCLPHSQ